MRGSERRNAHLCQPCWVCVHPDVRPQSRERRARGEPELNSLRASFRSEHLERVAYRGDEVERNRSDRVALELDLGESLRMERWLVEQEV